MNSNQPTKQTSMVYLDKIFKKFGNKFSPGGATVLTKIYIFFVFLSYSKASFEIDNTQTLKKGYNKFLVRRDGRNLVISS